ncbi:hypothetical protein Dimus_026890, partial [Dionaea muscipula]
GAAWGGDGMKVAGDGGNGDGLGGRRWLLSATMEVEVVMGDGQIWCGEAGGGARVSSSSV